MSELEIHIENNGLMTNDEFVHKYPPTTPIGILLSDGTIQATDYQLQNIHEFLKAFVNDTNEEIPE